MVKKKLANKFLHGKKDEIVLEANLDAYIRMTVWH